MQLIKRIKGCLLGGALGDALGTAIEFQDWPSIKREFGANGVQNFKTTFGMMCYSEEICWASASQKSYPLKAST